jgi:hypothetical protein
MICGNIPRKIEGTNFFLFLISFFDYLVNTGDFCFTNHANGFPPILLSTRSAMVPRETGKEDLRNHFANEQ